MPRRREEKSTQGQGKLYVMFPLLLCAALAGGIWIGWMVSDNKPNNYTITKGTNGDKFAKIVRFVEEEYVEEVDTEPLIDDAIQGFLQDLDPHSYYISSAEREDYSAPLDGNFDGIGVEFRIQHDTIVVVNPVSGGPSERVGIRPGDRIVTVEDTVVAGVGITNKRVMELLRGERNTKVNVGIKRGIKNDLIDFTITRGEIPIKSVPAWLRVDDHSAYVRLSRFASTTHEEFQTVLNEMRGQEISNLIVDLRGNGGGYLRTAYDMADEFLDRGKLIVYTEGRTEGRQTYEATRAGKLEDVEVVILIDEGSASASEILAGAIQDHDRGTIIGRRSFGKGLVQQEIPLGDNSAFRLTIARYYTPTGRCIQKPYGEGVDYENDYFDRLERGELLSADSIDFPDSLKFVTPGGKVVYGGGGIMPDIFVPIDTTRNSDYLSEVLYAGLINEYAFDYVDQRRDKLNAFGDSKKFDEQFTLSDSDLDHFFNFCAKEGVERDENDIRISKQEFRYRLKANIARDVWGDEGFYRVILKEDEVFEAAMNFFSESKGS